MRKIHTEKEIQAPPEAVWEVITDLDSYEDWNPHIVSASPDGELKEGSNVDVVLQPSGMSSMDATVEITSLEPEHKLTWEGTLFVSLVFKGVHTFELEPLDGDRTRFVNREKLSGLVVPFVTDEDTEEDYEEMNEALAERAEAMYAEG